jgi:hypothetical protein
MQDFVEGQDDARLNEMVERAAASLSAAHRRQLKRQDS